MTNRDWLYAVLAGLLFMAAVGLFSLWRTETLGQCVQIHIVYTAKGPMQGCVKWEDR
jgi:hypothetical protein